jgi:isopenicillin-N epimerase
MKNQFMLDPKIIYLNHGSFGACAKPIFNDLLKWQKKLEVEPVKFFEETLFKSLETSRKALGNYINCHPNDLVYFPNPTTAVNAVAKSLKLNKNDEVLSTNHIYGALDRTWQYICDDKKANFVKAKIEIPINSKKEFLEKFLNSVTINTKVIFISHLTSMTAMIFPVEEIISFAKKNRILTIIDGAHVPGHMALDLMTLDPDIYVGACHKWMCTPKGVSFLYVKNELQSKVHPIIISWGWNSENPGISKFLDWHEWQGTRDMSAFLTIPEAINFLNKHDWPTLSKTCKKKVVKLRNEFIDLLNFVPPCPNDWLGQMASIPIPVNDSENFRKKLSSDYNIQIPVFKWEDKTLLRYSIQTYNSDDELEKLLHAVKELLY